MNRLFKCVVYSFIAFSFFFSFDLNSKAITISSSEIILLQPGARGNGFNNSHSGGFGSNTEYADVEEEDQCKFLFGDSKNDGSVAYWIQWILNVMKYIAIVALLGLSTADFIKALISNDKDAVQKAGMTTAKRFIYCVLIFFLPTIVEIIMTMFGAYGTCGLG